MNLPLLRAYINQYKFNFDSISYQEIYKWKAIKCFQDNWNLDERNLHDMFVRSIKKTKNLLRSGNYFPLRMMKQYSRLKPEKIRRYLRNLFDEEEDLYQRIEHFQEKINLLNEQLFPGKNSFQDHRAIFVYLTLRYPERYFFYKYDMYKSFADKLDLNYKPVKGRIENTGHFISLCEIVRGELSKDQELLKKHKDRITDDCYYDENFNILTQDFIYSVARHLNPVKIPSFNKSKTTINNKPDFSTSINVGSDPVSFQGRFINFSQNSLDNKRIGDLGEEWVIAYERQKLIKLGKTKLANKVNHTSRTEGDGTGYDIKSFDKNGQEIYIEVKTTKNNKNSPFYISRNELERSKQEKEQYYLYRVYNYDEINDNADLHIIIGDLTNLCRVPFTYKITIK